MIGINCISLKKAYIFILFFRAISITAVNHANSGGEGWWNKLLHVRKIEPGKDSHSKLLSDTERVYELQSRVYFIYWKNTLLTVVL